MDSEAERRDDIEENSDDATDVRDAEAGQRGAEAQHRDDVADVRDAEAGQRDAEAAHRDDVADERDVESEQRDVEADVRDEAADERDADAEQRDVDAEGRDEVADERDLESEQRDDDGDRRDSTADGRDASASRRDQAADQRDQAAERRDREAEAVDRAGLVTGTAAVRAGRSTRAQAASDRRLARDDRLAAAAERTGSAADRATALSDRTAGADERDLSGRERDTALADRDSASADRVAGADHRGSSGQDRGTALADRVAGASGRGWSGLDRGATLDDRAASAGDRRSAAAYAALELRIAESETRAWRLLQAIADPVVVADANGTIELINAHAVLLFGYQSDELIGQPMEWLIPTGLSEASHRYRTVEVAAGQPRMITESNLLAVRKDGSTIPVEINLSAITLSNGEAVLVTIRDVSDRILSETELRISDERFQVSFDRAPIGMALIDLRPGTVGRFLRVNQALCAMTGYSEAALLATDTAAITHPDDRAQTTTNLGRLALGAAVRWDADKRYRGATGDDVWVHIAISVVHDADGRPSYGVSQVEDISGRKHMEAQLEERFHELATNVDVGFSVRQIDPPKLIYFNPAYLTVFGFDRSGPDPTPGDGLALVGPEDIRRVEAILAGAARGHRVEEEWQFTRPDGQLRWVSGRFSPITDSDGKIRRVAGLFEDITDRRNAEVVLAESQEQFRELANNVDVGFSIREPGGSAYLYLNSRFQAIFGFDPAADWPTPEQVMARVHPGDESRSEWVLPDVAQVDRTSDEWRIAVPGSPVRWIRGNTFPVLDGDGNVRRLVGIVEDITERKAAERTVLEARTEAERANAAKTQFLSRMSHELRTPLNAILGFGQLMEMDELTVKHRDGVQHILRAGEHLLGLIDEILDISRVETGAIRLSVEAVRVADVVEQTVEMLAPLAARQNVQIVVNKVGLDTHVLADQRRFKQVVVNLLANAVKYNVDGGSVRIESEVTGNGIFRLTISDTGIGIAAGDLGRLFQPFERLAAEHSDVEGTGLGLALTRHLMTEMGGEVGVRSRLGQGSSFWIQLPTTQPVLESPPVSLRPALDRPLTSGGSKTVLYVEDNLSNVRLMEQIMARRTDVNLLVAMQGQLGIDLAVAHQPDLILLDLHLPDITGEEVLRRLRADPRTATTPIVILSADATTDRPERLIEQGATSYLTKPLNILLILDMVDRVEATPSPAAAEPVRPATVGTPETRSDTTDVVMEAETFPDDDDDPMVVFVHDLVNLLGVILSYSDLLAQDKTHPSRARWLELQGSAAEQAIEMTRALAPQLRG